MSANVIVLSGRLVRDAEVRETQAGSQVADARIAVDNRRFDKTKDEYVNEPVFIDIVGFGKQAESFSKFFKKGTLILVTGSLRMREYEKDGQKRQHYSVIVDKWNFLEPKRKDGTEGTPASNGEAKAPRKASAKVSSAMTSEPDVDLDTGGGSDLPF